MRTRSLLALIIVVAASMAISQAPDKAAGGRELIVAAGCYACHDIPGFEGFVFSAPALDNAGNKLRSGWLHGWLRDPNAHGRSRMSDFRLTSADTGHLEDFLRSRRMSPSRHAPIDWRLADVAAGGRAFEKLKCNSCHASYQGFGRKLQREWIAAFLTDPEGMQPGTPMLKFHLSSSEVRDLTAYLLQTTAAFSEDTADLQDVPEPDSMDIGRALFESRGCSGCHHLAGASAPLKIGPSLAQLRSRYPNAWTLRAHLMSTLMWPEGTTVPAHMPSFLFSNREAAQIAAALLDAGVDRSDNQGGH